MVCRASVSRTIQIDSEMEQHQGPRIISIRSYEKRILLRVCYPRALDTEESRSYLLVHQSNGSTIFTKLPDGL